jgi:hypothetical protein
LPIKVIEGVNHLLGGIGVRRYISILSFSILLCVVLWFSNVYAAKKIHFSVNGEQQNLNDLPLVRGNELLFPFDETLKLLSANITWDQSKQKATVLHENGSFTLQVNSDKAVVNAKLYKLDGMLKKGKVPMIPASLLEDLMPVKVQWDKTNNKVNLEYREFPFSFPSNLHKKVALGDSPAFTIPVQNESLKTKEVFLKIPSQYKAYFTVNKSSLKLSPGEKGIFQIKAKKPTSKTGIHKFRVSIMTKSGSESQLELQYEVLEYSLSNHERPNSFINKDQVARAKLRIQTEKWAKNYWVKVKKEADQWLKQDLLVPSKPAGHSSWYVCKDGTPLKYVNGEHYCSSDKINYFGKKYDAGQLFYRHNDLVRALKILSTAYVLSGEEKYGKAAKNILLGYAEAYPNYPVQSRGGRMYWQSLDEAVSMIDLIQSYEFLSNSNLLTDQDRRNIELNLILPSAETLKAYPMGRSNWQAWHDAAIGMAGFALGNRELMNEAINGKYGFEYLMKNGVMEDGFWWEGSIAYHFYALAPLNILAEAASNWGYKLFEKQALKKMFDAPILYAYPNLMLPSNNDGGKFADSLIDSISSRGFKEYESAYAQYKDLSYGWLLNKKYQNMSRSGDFALFFGTDKLPGAAPPSLESFNFKNIGHGVLRSHTDRLENQNYLLLDYGPHGGSHGHLDKLSIDFFGAGKMLAPDFGTPGYSHPLYQTWYKQTVSHNTVVVDGQSQMESSGEIVSFITEPEFQYMHARANQAYKGVNYQRSIWMESEYILDWFSVSDPSKKHNYDWFLHGLGTLDVGRALQTHKNPASAFGYNKYGYEFISNIKSGTMQNNLEALWDQNGTGFRSYSIWSGQPTKVFTAFGPGPSTKPNEKTPILIQRQSGHSADFINVYQPYTGKRYLKITGLKEGLNGVRVDVEKESRHYYRNVQPSIKGQLLSAKGITQKGVSLYFDRVISLLVKKEKLEVEVKKLQKFQSLTLVVYSPDSKEVFLNGKKINAKFQGNQIIIKHTQYNNNRLGKGIRNGN